MRWLLFLLAAGSSSLSFSMNPELMDFNDAHLAKEEYGGRDWQARRSFDEAQKPFVIPGSWEFTYGAEGSLALYASDEAPPKGGRFSFQPVSGPLRLKTGGEWKQIELKGQFVIVGKWKGAGPCPARASIGLESSVEALGEKETKVIGGSDLHLPWREESGRHSADGWATAEVEPSSDGSFRLPVRFHYVITRPSQGTGGSELTVGLKAEGVLNGIALVASEGFKGVKRPEGAGDASVEAGQTPLFSGLEACLALKRGQGLLGSSDWEGEFEFDLRKSSPGRIASPSFHAPSDVKVELVRTDPPSARVRIRMADADYAKEMSLHGEIVRCLAITAEDFAPAVKIGASSQQLRADLVIRVKKPVHFLTMGPSRKVYFCTERRGNWEKQSATYLISPGIRTQSVSHDLKSLTLSAPEVAKMQRSFPASRLPVVWRALKREVSQEEVRKMSLTMVNPGHRSMTVWLTTSLTCLEQRLRVRSYGPKGRTADREILYRQFSDPNPGWPGMKDLEAEYVYALENDEGKNPMKLKPAYGPYPYFAQESREVLALTRVDQSLWTGQVPSQP